MHLHSGLTQRQPCIARGGVVDDFFTLYRINLILIQGIITSHSVYEPALVARMIPKKALPSSDRTLGFSPNGFIWMVLSGED